MARQTPFVRTPLPQKIGMREMREKEEEEEEEDDKEEDVGGRTKFRKKKGRKRSKEMTEKKMKREGETQGSRMRRRRRKSRRRSRRRRMRRQRTTRQSGKGREWRRRMTRSRSRKRRREAGSLSADKRFFFFLLGWRRQTKSRRNMFKHLWMWFWRFNVMPRKGAIWIARLAFVFFIFFPFVRVSQNQRVVLLVRTHVAVRLRGFPP